MSELIVYGPMDRRRPAGMRAGEAARERRVGTELSFLD